MPYFRVLSVPYLQYSLTLALETLYPQHLYENGELQQMWTDRAF
jgi:hypothetical protein